jgi:polyisoprenoid-binding protein YceI
MKPLVLFFCAGLVCLTTAAAETYTIDGAHSRIAFGVHHFIGVTKGRFSKFSGTINVDREHPERSSVSVQIQVQSIDTGIRKRDDHLGSAEFFDATKYPQIIFKSRSVKRTGADSGDIAGDLTMHGVTRPIILHVKLSSPASEAQLPSRTHWNVSTAPLKRKDFGLMFSSTAETVSGIGQEVSVEMAIDAVRE